MNKPRSLVLTTAITVVLIILASVMPAQSAVTMGAWRLISPTEYTSIPDAELHGIFLTSGGTSGKGSGNGWAVGQNGFIFNWDGFSWNQASSPTTCELDAVNFGGPLNPLSSVTSSSGWAVGGCNAAPNDGSALYYNGISWVSYPVPSAGPGRLLSVSLVKSASSPGDSVNAFAVGIDGGGGAFWSWSGVPGSGGGWSELSTTGAQVNSVYMTHCTGSPCSGDDGIAVGNGGTIFRFVGGIWTARASPVGVNLNSVAMSSPTNGWAVGDGGTIIRTTDGNTWTGPVSPGTTTNILRSIVLLSSSEAYAVGDADAGGATVLHGISLDSTPVWSRLPVNQIATPLSLDSVTFATSGGNIWSVGKSGVAAFCLNNCGSASSAIWSTTTSPNTLELDSVFMVSDSDAWAVGIADGAGNPTVLRWDGGTFSWTRAPFVAPLISPTSLHGVYLSGGSSGWAVGGTGAAPSTLWYDGNTWTGKTVGSPCVCTLNSLYMVSDSNSWAVGTVGTIMHSSSPAGSFSIAPSSVAGATYNSVFFDTSSGGMSGWAAGTNAGSPVMVHTTNGGADAWPVVGIPAKAGFTTINSLFFQDSTHAWAAGDGSTILYWNGVSWTLVSIVGAVNPITIDGIAVTGGPPATDGWAVGVDTVSGLPITIHYDGTSWTVTTLTPAIPNKGELKSLSLRSSTNGLAVGTGVTGAPTTLSFILHLDPPGGVTGSTTTPVTTTTTASTTVTSTTSTSTAATSTSAASSTFSASTSTSSTETVVSTSSSTETVVSTTTETTSSSSSVSTPLVMPPIPGFPWESIIAGIIFGTAVLAVLRRRRK